MVIEIVSFPSYKMVIFHSYVSLPEGNVQLVFLEIQNLIRSHHSIRSQFS